MTRMARRNFTDRADRQLDSLLNQQEVSWQFGTDRDLEVANQLILDALGKRLPVSIEPSNRVSPIKVALDNQRAAFRLGDQDRLEKANEKLDALNRYVLPDEGSASPGPQ